MSPAAARRAAASILAESRFHDSSVPRPLHGVLVWVGRAITNPLAELGRLIDDLGKLLPGGVVGVWLALAVAAAGGAAAVAHHHARGRLRVAARAAGGSGDDDVDSTRSLLRAAERAEREGRLAEAVRLRFRAGLVTLGRRRELPALKTPNAALARRVGNPHFTELARTVDRISYGGADATPDDVQQQRREWPAILRAGERDSGRRDSGERDSDEREPVAGGPR